jgi:hypothetical protein
MLSAKLLSIGRHSEFAVGSNSLGYAHTQTRLLVRWSRPPPRLRDLPSACRMPRDSFVSRLLRSRGRRVASGESQGRTAGLSGSNGLLRLPDRHTPACIRAIHLLLLLLSGSPGE